MNTRPIAIVHALDLVRRVHRRLPKLQGALWAIALTKEDDESIGVVVIGRPTARALPQCGRMLQVLRCAVPEGVPNGCSMLYGSAARAAKAMGAESMFTYIHEDESGVSLKASGWVEDTQFSSRGGEWSRSSRPRAKTVEIEPKKRYWTPWSKYLKDQEVIW